MGPRGPALTPARWRRLWLLAALLALRLRRGAATGVSPNALAAYSGNALSSPASVPMQCGVNIYSRAHAETLLACAARVSLSLFGGRGHQHISAAPQTWRLAGRAHRWERSEEKI